jgi:cysteine desulfurase/selenocysteine lyase
LNIRNDFPQLLSSENGGPITYLDNAASTLKPQVVIDAITHHYTHEASNIHRGIHTLAEIGTDKYEATRDKVQKLINANSRKEIIFTKGTTDSINLVARTFGDKFINEGDEIIISEMEHHSNIVPWQLLKERTGCVIKVIPLKDDLTLDTNKLEDLITNKTKLISVVWFSNSLGVMNPVRDIIEVAKKNNVKTLIDAAQVMAHDKVDVQELDCDFLVFSGHKIFGPTGTGVLYGKEKLLDEMPPFEGGGDMIDTVTFEKTTFNELPYKFEAGTPHIAGFIGLGYAVDYLMGLGFENIKSHTQALLNDCQKRMEDLPGITIHGKNIQRSAIIAFSHETLHPQDFATFLNKYKIAIRTGHHCTQPLLKKMGVSATARVSFAAYNNQADVDHFIESLAEIIEMFA